MARDAKITIQNIKRNKYTASGRQLLGFQTRDLQEGDQSIQLKQRSHSIENLSKLASRLEVRLGLASRPLPHVQQAVQGIGLDVGTRGTCSANTAPMITSARIAGSRLKKQTSEQCRRHARTRPGLAPNGSKRFQR